MAPYREPEEPIEPTDGEALALAELTRRARRVRTGILVPGLVGTMFAGLLLALALREAQFIVLNGHFPYATAAMVAPAVAWAMRRSARLADLAVRQRAPAWRAELAKLHDLDAASLEELTQFL